MKANYHTHTPRCNHAKGSETEYISRAISENMEILGFSDHTPYFFPGNYYSSFRMRPELLRDYTDTLTALRKAYAGKIELYIGLEAEYYPAYFTELKAFLQDYPVEYLILGQHFVGNEPDGQYSGTPTADSDILKTYTHQVCDAMQTGCFTYFAHPDIINFQGDERTYRQYMRQMIREAGSCNVPLEINMLGLNEGRQYPSRRFLELVAEENQSMILGCDAHTPEALGSKKIETAAKNLAEEFGIRLMDTVSLKSIH